MRDASVASDELQETCFDLCSQCNKILERFKDFEFQPVKPHKADLTDAGPGVVVNNIDIKFRDEELTIIQNSEYRIRCHRSRGDSEQGEAERTNSAIGDALVDGATIDWEFKKDLLI